ncbi:hypothetical protein LWI29_030338 [Acer saccharum]|uniref:Terpene synthase metal-binding domain-containing protein n=1 Tax=Acer saccharum TaxID=4024 RepID=A0AA39VQP2_ACESA|nr:hypothetical protein LWI29_030338 [Acer saccharum]
MGSKVTKEDFDWAISKPKILKAADTVARFVDIRSHKFEQERGSSVASVVECYMNQYGVSEQEAYEEL